MRKSLPRTMVAWVCVVLASGAAASAAAGEAKTGAAKLATAAGTVLMRPRADAAWTAPPLGTAVPTGARLLALPGARGALTATQGTRLTLQGNVPGLSSTPVLGTLIELHAPGKRAFDVTLDHGIVILHTPRAPAQARVRIADTNVEITLPAKETRVAVESFTYWPVGTPFRPRADVKPLPQRELFVFVLAGRAEIALKGVTHTLTGPAFFHGSSGRAAIAGPARLEKMPKWLDPGADTSKEAAALHRAVERLRRLSAEKPAVEAVAILAKDKSVPAQVVAAYSAAELGATDRVIDALHSPAPATRQAAIVALRAFGGRGAAQDEQIFEGLRKHKYTPGQAEIAMFLLRGLDAEARRQHETYDTLIRYLSNDQLGIRALAAWSLTQLVPQGRAIGYDPAADAATRARAQAAWRKLIPEGKLPPASK